MKYIQYFIALGLLLIGLSAIAGGYKVITTNGMGMPVSLLKNSPFTSYFWPGMILLFVVGGTHMIGAFSIVKKHRFAPELAAIAGFGMTIWTFTEIYILNHAIFLQALYFGFGIVTLIGAYILSKYGKYTS